MVARIALLAMLATWSHFAQGQQFLMEGFVRIANSDRTLPGANIVVKGSGTGVSADSLGYFRIYTAAGTQTLIISYVGFRTKEIKVNADRNRKINIILQEANPVLEEVLVVSNTPDNNFNSTDIGVSKLNIETIKKMPAFMGERDILKSILLLPGVTSVGEGTSGINVRGGNTDQNLLLMDGAPLFNPSHLMGFLSIYNPDVVDYFTFYKGGIPAKFGGRISSIFDTHLKSPAMDKWSVEGGLGLIANRLKIEGPILKDKLSFLVAARVSFPDYLFQLSNQPEVQNTKANFYDLTAKTEYRINDNQKLTLTIYRSEDNFKLSGDSLAAIEINASSSLFNWQTDNASLRWSAKTGKHSTLNLTFIQSIYQSQMSNEDSLTAYQLNSSIRYRQVKAEHDWFPDERNEVSIGVSAIQYNVKPGTLNPGSPASAVNFLEIPQDNGLECASFINHDWKVIDKFSLMYGLRVSAYFNLGEKYVYTYAPNAPLNEGSVVDSTYYEKGTVASSYVGIEPRISAKYNVGNTSSIKLSYNRMFQYIQQISNTTAALPTDRWQLATNYIKPQSADQLSIGYFRNFNNNIFETSLEVYYKNIQNATDYKDGVNLLLNPIPETALLQGKGKAYGVELFIRKNKGRFTGWTSYTYSQTWLKINGLYPEEKINGGDWYPANYNKPNTLNIVVSYKAKPRISYSANFTYSTGRPVTYPEDKYIVNGTYIPNYVGRNTEKIPDYHRLDLSMTIDEKPSHTRTWKSSWVFSIYNVYARENAYSIFFRTKNDNYALYLKKANAYKLSIYGTIFPSITYNFRF